MNINTFPLMTLLSVIATIALTVLAYIFIVPKSKCAKLGKIGEFLHDLVSFNFLIIEKFLQFIYIVLTLAALAFGFFMLFSFSIYKGSYGTFSTWAAGYGILMIIFGPIVIRMVYECIMLSLILVKNVIQINNKIKSDDEQLSPFAIPNVKDLFKKEAAPSDAVGEVPTEEPTVEPAEEPAEE